MKFISFNKILHVTHIFGVICLKLLHIFVEWLFNAMSFKIKTPMVFWFKHYKVILDILVIKKKFEISKTDLRS